jgi:DNA repair protein RecO
MFVNYRTQGIIIKKEDRGEANQLFTIYTKDFGKLEIFGKAIRKISSKLRAGTDVFYLTDIEFIQGKAHKTLTDAVLIEKFEDLRKDLNKLKIAYKISEILDELIKGQEPDEEIWDLLNKAFQRLNDLKLKIKNWKLIYYYFLWNLFSLLGYEPQLYNCSICQEKLKPEKFCNNAEHLKVPRSEATSGFCNNAEHLKVPRSEATSGFYFNPREGGIICAQCSKKIERKREIKIETIKIIRILLKKNWQILKRLKLEPEDLRELKLISNYFLLYIKKEVGGNN